jgi:inositol oxygenase
MTQHDVDMFEWVKKFNPYDLYSKGATRPKLSEVKSYYEDLIAEFYPAELQF